jgi:hypothetical protein
MKENIQNTNTKKLHVKTYLKGLHEKINLNKLSKKCNDRENNLVIFSSSSN